MLKKIMMICTLAICGVVGLHAVDQEIPSNLIEQSNPLEQNDEENGQSLTNAENEKDLTPGLLICNGKEDKCSKEGEQEETSSSNLFSVFSEDKEDEVKLLACKECR